jgi:hypothetical protein
MSWKEERDCNIFELYYRKFITSVLYFRLYRRLYPDTPFYTPGAIRTIKKLLNKNSRVFEWGSGKSSLWFSKRVAEYICVEHDKLWFDEVLTTFNENKTQNAKIVYIPANKINDSYHWDKDWPHYKLLNHPPTKPEFRNYMMHIDNYPDKYFDCIVVDGRERVGCMLHALSKIKSDGFIIFDDSNRPRYKEIFTSLPNWQIKKFDFGLAQTSIFKPV